MWSCSCTHTSKHAPANTAARGAALCCCREQTARRHGRARTRANRHKYAQALPTCGCIHCERACKSTRTPFAVARTVAWRAAQENLPLEYAKIYQFENWPAIQREVLHTQAIEADEETEAAQGSFVEVELWVPLAFSELFGIGGDIDADADAAATAEADTGGTLQGRNALLVLSSVNTHENRLSVVHFTIRWADGGHCTGEAKRLK
eukprot:3440201-Pleurochrysis_carterae.AAC.2